MEGLDSVKESYGRACLHPHLIDRFYNIFLDSHPDIKPMFKNTDFKKQHALLKTGVIMLLAHLSGKSIWTENLDKIAESHSKKNLNIHPTLYPYWIDSLVCAVKENDEKWTPELEQNWRKILKVGVTYLTDRYEMS